MKSTTREAIQDTLITLFLIGFTLLAFWWLTGCTTVQTRTTKITTAGAAKVIEVNPTTGFVRIEDLSSPLQSAISALNTGLFAWFSGTFIR